MENEKINKGFYALDYLLTVRCIEASVISNIAIIKEALD